MLTQVSPGGTTQLKPARETASCPGFGAELPVHVTSVGRWSQQGSRLVENGAHAAKEHAQKTLQSHLVNWQAKWLQGAQGRSRPEEHLR